MRAFALALGAAVGALGLLPPDLLVAQDVAARLNGRVPAPVAQAVQEIAADARARGLPVEPLLQKALEGGAKGVPADRVIAAVRVLAARLDEARGALQQGGIRTPSAEALESGAYALNAGLNSGQVRDLVRVSRDPYDPALTLRIAATLTVLGVPARQGLHLVERMIEDRRGPSALLDLPTQVQEGMAHGATPAEAAEGLEGREDHRGDRHQEGDAHRPPRKP
ncbi:MAG TPA: hypothetical protein VM716_03135 [Gemmatimonadales bacterium]|nr:hypothetical protein [Gemmatimonadales bacterium]